MLILNTDDSAHLPTKHATLIGIDGSQRNAEKDRDEEIYKVSAYTELPTVTCMMNQDSTVSV